MPSYHEIQSAFQQALAEIQAQHDQATAFLQKLAVHLVRQLGWPNRDMSILEPDISDAEERPIALLNKTGTACFEYNGRVWLVLAFHLREGRRVPLKISVKRADYDPARPAAHMSSWTVHFRARREYQPVTVDEQNDHQMASLCETISEALKAEAVLAAQSPLT
ncbi:hypothetical protein WME88_27595 [Sorangium sp. So ce216]